MTWTRITATATRVARALPAVVAFAAPFAVSLAANITAGLQSGSHVLLVAGVAIPILLMLAIERWRRLPAATGAARAVRAIAMAAPVAVAAGWSWYDTTHLLLAQFDDPWWLQRVLCIAAPLAVDGLAVLAVLARDEPTPVAPTGRRSNSAPDPVGASTSPVTSAPPVTASPAWGPADTVTTPIRPRPVTARPVTTTAGRRTRNELVAAGAPLGVKRSARESTEDLRARVEAAEAARDRDRGAVA